MKVQPQYIMDFIRAICPESPELYMSFFTEKTALQDATKLITTQANDIVRLTSDMKYIAGIVKRGTGLELKKDMPIREQLLDYVKQLETKARAYDDSRKAMKGV